MEKFVYTLCVKQKGSNNELYSGESVTVLDQGTSPTVNRCFLPQNKFMEDSAERFHRNTKYFFCYLHHFLCMVSCHLWVGWNHSNVILHCLFHSLALVD